MATLGLAVITDAEWVMSPEVLNGLVYVLEEILSQKSPLFPAAAAGGSLTQSDLEHLFDWCQFGQDALQDIPEVDRS